jgi:hypothetical protein
MTFIFMEIHLFLSTRIKEWYSMLFWIPASKKRFNAGPFRGFINIFA